MEGYFINEKNMHVEFKLGVGCNEKYFVKRSIEEHRELSKVLNL